MESWSARLLDLGENECHLYCGPANQAVEWSLQDVTAWVWTSSDPKARARNFKGCNDVVSAVHDDMYGEKPAKLRQITADREKDAGQAMMYERTLPTNHVCALLVHALTAGKATQVSFEQHRRTSGILFDVLHRVCSSRFGGMLSIRHLGTGARSTVAANSVFSSEDVWAESVRALLEEEWMAHCHDDTRLWHRSSCSTMTVPEFVVFGLDGHGSLKRFSFLRIAAQDLLKQCFDALTHPCLVELSRPVSLSSGPAQLGTTSKIRKGAAVKAYFDACEMVASGDVALAANVLVFPP